MIVPGNVVAVSNGKQVNPPGKYPFVINADSCTAVLVSPNIAIGVAHCCYNKLLVGGHNISALEVGREEFEVAETIHATGDRIPYVFRYGENFYDIVILRLNGFSNHLPVEINDFDPPVYENEIPPESQVLDLLVTGWGSDRRGEYMSETLKETSVDLIPIVKCKQIYNSRVETWYGGGRRDLLCASKSIDGQVSGPCTGDDGAPLVNMKNGKLVGIVTLSFVRSCANEEFPSVFTNTFYYKDWIETNIDKFACPWFDTIKYPTSAPTFTKLPSFNPTINPSMIASVDPTVVLTLNPTSFPSLIPTKNPTKKIKNSKKKAENKQAIDASAHDESNNCYWVPEMVQENVNVVRKDLSTEQYEEIETIIRRKVFTLSCDTNESTKHDIVTMAPTGKELVMFSSDPRNKKSKTKKANKKVNKS